MALLGKKPIDELPQCIQHLKMRLIKYQYCILHVPGKSLVIADTLSHAPFSKPILMILTLEQNCMLLTKKVDQTETDLAVI